MWVRDAVCCEVEDEVDSAGRSDIGASDGRLIVEGISIQLVTSLIMYSSRKAVSAASCAIFRRFSPDGFSPGANSGAPER